MPIRLLHDTDELTNYNYLLAVEAEVELQNCIRCDSNKYQFFGVDNYQSEGYLYIIKCPDCGNWEPFKTRLPRDHDVFTEDAANVWNDS
jgi:hypothetical protein